MLRHFPEIGRVLPEKGLEHLREIIARPYRIIYRYDAERRLVEVWRFWHGARGTPEVPAQD